MAATADGSTLPEFLKPFHERASLAEERLAKIEAALKNNTVNVSSDHSELLNSMLELRLKLEKAKTQFAAEKEQLQKEQERLAAENAKLQYRVTHLVRAVEEADARFEKSTSNNSA